MSIDNKLWGEGSKWWFILRAGMALAFQKCEISSHNGTQLTGVSMCSCCTGMTQQEAHKRDLSLFSSQCWQKLLPSASSRRSFTHRSSTKLSRHISEVHDSVSRSPRAPHPPGSGPGTHPHLPMDQPLSFLALYNPQSASRLWAEQLLTGWPNVPSVPCPVCPDNSPDMACTCFWFKRCLWT